ncbi:MAG: hypothetical protein ACK4SN_15205, partial [Bellilinea sp.]
LEMRLESIQNLREMAEEGLQGLTEDHPARQRMDEIIEWSTLLEKSYQKILEEWQSRREIPA